MTIVPYKYKDNAVHTNIRYIIQLYMSYIVHEQQ